MADVFISYARKDQPVAIWLSEALGREGWDVWWDRDLIPGREFDKTIQENLTAAKCIVVLWSTASIDSIWVRAEANQGLARGCLIPVSISTAKPPLPFNQIETIDMMGWRGDPVHPAFQRLLNALTDRLGRPAAEQSPSERPHFDPQRFSLIVARVQNDIGQVLQDVIATDLQEFEGIQVAKVDAIMNVEGPVPEESDRAAADRARAYLEEAGGTVMIWGKILRFAGKEAPQLHLTVSRSKEQKRGRYMPTDELRLPQVFWSDLSDILRLVILTYDADLVENEGFYLGDQLRPFIPRVRRLLQGASEQQGWSREACGLTRISLADALMLLGGQSGENELLIEAIETYQKAIAELPREQAPLDWARAQNGLGIAFWMLGDRQQSTELLEQAVDTYQHALRERTRERVPLDWAQTHNDLGNALLSLGRRECGTARIEDAVTAYEAALMERTHENKPLDWAQTQNNLAVALLRLGERRSGTALLEQAVGVLEQSLTVYTRQRTPLDWAQTQNNLGLVLWTLGQRESRAPILARAVDAFQAALSERPREHVPLLWAQTQNNLGLALWSLGDLTDDIRLLEEAIGAFRSALAEQIEDRAPMEWARTQNSLGAVLWTLGLRKNEVSVFEEAVQAYRAALRIISQEKAPFEWAQIRRNFGNAATSLGDLKGNMALLEEAVESLQAAVTEYNRGGEKILWAQAQGDLAYTLRTLGQHQRDIELLERAWKAFEASQHTCMEAGLEEEAKYYASQVQMTKRLTADMKVNRAVCGCPQGRSMKP